LTGRSPLVCWGHCGGASGEVFRANFGTRSRQLRRVGGPLTAVVAKATAGIWFSPLSVNAVSQRRCKSAGPVWLTTIKHIKEQTLMQRETP
jgi:hypothetical protein